MGVYLPGGEEKVSRIVFYGLLALQHRGQESAGISVWNGSGIRTRVGMGLVSQVFDSNALEELRGSLAIGHVRYSTAGASAAYNAQPMEIGMPAKLSIGFNGNLINHDAMRKSLASRGHSFQSTTDAEVLGRFIADELEARADVFQAFRAVMEALEGAYSLTMLTREGIVVAARDPLGFRPLCIGSLGEGYVVASETVALEAVGASYVRDVDPGEVVAVGEDGLRGEKMADWGRHAHCMFEWVYFARPDSAIEGRLPYDVRVRLGELLYDLAPVEADAVVGVPDSGRAAAEGYARGSGIQQREGLMPNRYVWRTFIMPDEDERAEYAKIKYNPVKPIVGGKRIVLVEDSIVRGTTLRGLVKLLKSAGAKEVHVRVSCPPLIAPCYMGIDFPTYEELVAPGRSVEEIRRIIDADSLVYMSIEGLVKAIGLPSAELCLACLTDEYPTRVRPTVRSRSEVKG